MPLEISIIELLKDSFTSTLLDIFPILLVLIFFQAIILRKKIPHLKQIVYGLVLVVVGLAIFIVGLEECVFPIGSRTIDPPSISCKW
jgi:ABC-type polysaccharide/polyol phosphate export permease